MYSKSIEQLIKAFSKLPSVGPRTAERFVFHLLKSGKKDAAEITNALKGLIENIKSCEICWDFSDTSPCKICADTKRDASALCIVTESQELQQIEKTGAFTGRYHVLRGVIKPGNPDSVKYLKVAELLKRVKIDDVKEIILALNPDLPGETTMLYLQNVMKKESPDIKVTRLARGLPMGSDLQYADEITLGSALKNRTQT
ncbi:MAG: Recombination protein RecR [Candidatus Magasanikbacteria bacterium GW2011_GWD2_43_18]|uniref:Recombination protein RecR n=1 Tax=Candidatus Magasanikbacteria bacterium GW2011_GWE2_42_7 TaxID=1619052 RepID=A0A0G1DKJ0_9BACT|nr:MAG: Recombination protein RecR [Candidatus Magasanikbacteria bacterium GW2011_GWC2_42_27]KKS71386.1 MAG: Recombination protein RecR [Candidatus Magasanikbacteria bacterium GW2011_GWE2_42_7]KKT04098.1 MAG: Recombination protein RecR [Candidatus Magasanikbacteria bacterium GW2011_GWD2_43_18]KKT24705.1 MAG: Recombination protein RecR [Candidatus Magasanikbacteria bacterium GW2011_GWA2_43_9]HBB38540.1 recombination protein RecR [Candidatus Magasanikbacteria bacterium]